MFWSIFYFWKYSWLIIVTYKSSCVSTQQYLCGLSDSRYRARVISNLKIRMKGIFIYVLQFDKMQNTSPFMCTKFEIWAQSILKVIQSFHTVRIVLYIGCSSPVVEDLNKIKMLQLTTRSLGKNTRTMRTVWKAWITFKLLQPQISNSFHIKVLLFCI